MSGFERGDRLPDFQRPDYRGETRLFYDLHPGEPSVLVLAGAEAAQAVLTAIRQPQSLWQRLACIVVALGTPSASAALLRGEPPPCTLLADDGVLTAHLLGESVPAGGIAIFALDANRRVIERLEGNDPKSLLARLAALYPETPDQPANVVHQQAPVLLIPRVFDPVLCQELIALFDRDGGQPSGVAQIEGDTAYWRPDPGVKMRRDFYIREGAWLNRIREPLARRVLPEIQRCFQFQVTQHEVFKLVRYDADTGGYFRPHRDNESRDTQHRRFAMTLNLNTGDYEGGQLRFPEFGPDLYQAERGGALVFSCSLLHEAMNVTRGKRYVLLGFFFGEAQAVAPIQYQTATS